MLNLRRGLAVLAAALLLGPASAAIASDAPDPARCAPDGVALGGYDVVSYFQQDPRPRAGRPDLAVDHEGLTYWFSEEANRQRFLSDRDRYLPEYGGWCSTNLAMGRLACPDYTNFKIEDDALLLFEHVGFTNGRDVWDADPARHRASADLNWRRLSARQ